VDFRADHDTLGKTKISFSCRESNRISSPSDKQPNCYSGYDILAVYIHALFSVCEEFLRLTVFEDICKAQIENLSVEGYN
jgi:hypothetical protein